MRGHAAAIRVALLVAVIAVLAAIGSAPYAGAAPSAAQSMAPGGAVQRFGGCLASGAQGRIVLVLDTSGSLEDTDPTAGRVAAAEYLVDQLAREVEREQIKIDVAVAGFSDDFTVYQDWTTLTTGSAAAVSSAVDEFEARDTGFETDYWNAATGARRYLAKGAGGEGESCRAWVWFSDGLYDLDKRDTDAERKAYGVTKDYGPMVELTSDEAVESVERAGRADLCREGGVADQLRSQDVYTFAVGLTVDNDDFSLMKGVADGSDVDGKACGANGANHGTFVLADDIDELFFALDAVTDTPIDQKSPLCKEGAASCEAATHRFVLDPTITSVHVLAGADVSGFHVVLIPPSGEELVLESGRPLSTTTPSASIEAAWVSEKSFEMDLAHRSADQGWVGPWQLQFVNDDGQGSARSNIHLYGDIEPAWLGADGTELRVGESVDLELGLVRISDGQPLDLSAVQSSISLGGALELADGSEVALPAITSAADLGQPVPLDLGQAAPGPATLHLDLQITTAPVDVGGRHFDGTPLEPESVDYAVQVLPPPNFPTLPESISFGRTKEEGDIPGLLSVSGDGCVWLAEAQSETTPEGVTATVSSSSADEGSCVDDSLPLTMSVAGLGSGLASGRLTVMTRSAESGVEAVPVTVAYRLEMTRPRDTTRFVLLLVLIFAGGLLLPIGLLYAAKWWTARIPGDALSFASAKGMVDRGASFLSSTSIAAQGMRSQTLVGTDRRSVQLNAESVLRTKVGLGLTEPGYALVDGQASASSAAPPTDRKGRRARLPLAVQDSWVALLDTADPGSGPVEVVFIVSPTSGRLPELLEDARARLHDVVAALRDRVGDGSGTGGTGGSGAGATQHATAGADEWGSPTAAARPAAASGDDWGSPMRGGGSTPRQPNPQPNPPPDNRGDSSSYDEW